jgi:peptide/nickel transport system permease protein
VLRFALERASQTVIVALVVVTLAFVLIHAAPGDPFSPSPDDPPELAVARERVRQAYGLDRPIVAQYGLLIANFGRGRFGDSFSEARPVGEVIAAVLPRTVLLMAPALLIGVIVGTLVGTWQGRRAGRRRERLVGAATLLVLSMPEFLIGLLAAVVFATRLNWLPATGMQTADLANAGGFAAAADLLRHLVLPGGTLTLAIAAMVARYQRANAIEAYGEEVVRAARARGASERRIAWVHVLRRTAGSLCAVIGVLLPMLVGGAALVENVFGWPGAGSTLLRAVSARDYPLVIGLVLVGSVAVCISSALSDAAAQLVNPRTRARA